MHVSAGRQHDRNTLPLSGAAERHEKVLNLFFWVGLARKVHVSYWKIVEARKSQDMWTRPVSSRR